MKSAYDDLKQQLGATNENLQQQNQDYLDQAQKNADQACSTGPARIRSARTSRA